MVLWSIFHGPSAREEYRREKAARGAKYADEEKRALLATENDGDHWQYGDAPNRKVQKCRQRLHEKHGIRIGKQYGCGAQGCAYRVGMKGQLRTGKITSDPGEAAVAKLMQESQRRKDYPSLLPRVLKVLDLDRCLGGSEKKTWLIVREDAVAAKDLYDANIPLNTSVPQAASSAAGEYFDCAGRENKKGLNKFCLRHAMTNFLPDKKYRPDNYKLALPLFRWFVRHGFNVIDLHGGNVGVASRDGRMVILDFGLVGYASPQKPSAEIELAGLRRRRGVKR